MPLSRDAIAFARQVAHPLAQRRALLGIDVGSRKSGFALALSPLHKATAIGTTRPPPRGAAPLPHFADLTAGLISTHAVGGIVVGWPLLPDGSESAECALVRDFCVHMRARRVLLPILAWDERGTTAEARAGMAEERRASGRQGRGVLPVELRQRVDGAAAVVMLDAAASAIAAALQSGKRTV
jgi:RNase H-fold protein (predicted Holliday junction resolvase)